eukprot:TRINITY_DN11378_c0_g1_i1.p1 TRINITY_DN11378_c0_g1~~TRINITY_DN11378_c0_g1_i1.p1  ORF type:complete len:101 (+),score=29.54 TRINITY_DN11378_c0_g1_i1:26-304(+)
MTDITVTISYGSSGGAPPNRTFRGSDKVISIPADATVEQYLSAVRAQTRSSVSLKSLNLEGFVATDDDLQKSVSECGLVSGSKFQLWNGMMD